MSNLQKFRTSPVKENVTIFPEKELINVHEDTEIKITGFGHAGGVIQGGEFYGKAIWLDSENFDWHLGKDDGGETILVPIKKERAKCDYLAGGF